VLDEPFIGSDPLHPPEAVQEVALVEDQDRADVAPLFIVLGFAARLTAGGVLVTETVADWLALPPVPVHAIPYAALAVRAPVDCEPLIALVPDQAPEPVQDVAFVAVHVKVELRPLAIELGLAEIEMVGAGELTDTVADCVAVPPVPVQLREYVALALSAPVGCEPLTAFVPDQPPEAVQEVALRADQVNVEPLPLATVLGLAAKVTAGAGAETDTVTDWLAFPPGPVQVMPKVPLALKAPVDWEPLTALVPDQPPEAVHAVVLVEDQVRLDAEPLATVLGAAAKLTMGAFAVTETVADWVALPLVPVQVSA
jgi:hypothetical protein